ncbi:hypothetical protein [Catenulispora rubra]|uniref:hypothetical protein n=1 Tax=Catenulispora rubra TaxID=280293 RepID=UPI0018922353|nr:hypothetical protein [Catenulispora rubra]
MPDETVFDHSDEPVMELVLSSDDEFTGVDAHSPEERRLRRDELRERFLPGVDAGALFALAASTVSLVTSGLFEILAQNRELTFTARYVNGSNPPDRYAPFRDMDHLRFLGQGLFAAVAVVVAALVATNWRAERHARWSRPAAQAALLLGLAGLAIAVLGYFDVIASLPSPQGPFLNDGGVQT